jgi:starch synthase (maltosyl-transferring)
MICYSKESDDRTSLVLVVVNLDNHWTQSGWVDLPLEEWGVDPNHPYQVHDLLTHSRFQWHGHRGYVELNPHVVPAHIFRLLRRVRSEHEFEYFA